MEKFKNNPLACLLLGIIIGASAILIGQALLGSSSGSPTGIHSLYTSGEEKPAKKLDNFDKVPLDVDGDVWITPAGGKYHRRYCTSLRNAKQIRQVNSSDAIKADLNPCSKCMY